MAVGPAPSTFVERSLEPVVASGRGMRVLGFVPVGGLRTQALHVSAEAKQRDVQPVSVASSGPVEQTSLRVNEAHHGRAEVSTDTPSMGGSSAAVDERTTSNGKEVRGPSSWKKGRPVYDRGNYGSYYGYRQSTPEYDHRLRAVADALGDDAFRDRDVLDIGCNTGRVPLAVARQFGARRVVGLDIDANLIEDAEAARDADCHASSSSSSGTDKSTVEFRAEDFLKTRLRRSPSTEPEKFDVILCLSVTKWVHFAEGDTGVRNLFKRVFKRLRPGGLFVLEPQNWDSYKKKRHVTRQIRETVAAIEMRPLAFDDYILSLGFVSAGVIEPPSEGPKGFQRSIRMYRRQAGNSMQQLQPGPEDTSSGKERKAERQNRDAASGPSDGEQIEPGAEVEACRKKLRRVGDEDDLQCAVVQKKTKKHRNSCHESQIEVGGTVEAPSAKRRRKHAKGVEGRAGEVVEQLSEQAVEAGAVPRKLKSNKVVKRLS